MSISAYYTCDRHRKFLIVDGGGGPHHQTSRFSTYIRLVFMTLHVFGRYKKGEGSKEFFRNKLGGADVFRKEIKGGGLFFKKKGGRPGGG